MRSYNSQPENKNKLKFYGFDFQRMEASLNGLRKYFTKVDKDFEEKIKNIQIVKSPHSLYGPYLKTEDIDAISQRLLTNSMTYIKITSRKEWALMVQLVQALKDASSQGRDGSVNFNRDLAIKKNIDWILEFEGPDSKIFLWSHNSHAMYDSALVSQTGERGKTMGQHLKESYVDELYTIGFDFNKGRFYANKPTHIGKVTSKHDMALTVFELAEAPSGTFAAMLSTLGVNILFMNFYGAKTDNEVTPWLKKNHMIRSIGGLVPEDCVTDQTCTFGPFTPLNSFDAIIFVNNTNQVTLLH